MLLVEDYLLNGFLVSGFEATMTGELLCMCVNDFHISSSNFLCLTAVACMVVSLHM